MWKGGLNTLQMHCKQKKKDISWAFSSTRASHLLLQNVIIHLKNESLWWYQNQFTQSTNHILQLHSVGQSLSVPPLQQQSLCLKKQLCSLRCWELVWSLGLAVEPLCWGDAVSVQLLHLEPDPVDLGEGGQRGGREGAQSTLQPLYSSVLSIPSAAPLFFLGHKIKKKVTKKHRVGIHNYHYILVW